MNETQIVQTALFNLEQTRNIAGKWEKKHPDEPLDGELELLFGLNQQTKKHFYVEVKRELRAHHLQQLEAIEATKRPLIVIAETIFPNVKEQLRDLKIAYLDAAGNIFLQDDQNYLWLEGNKYVKHTSSNKNRAFTKTGLKVIFYFLTNNDGINRTYQQIANATNVAIGNIKNILDGLRETGYLLQLTEKKMKLINKPGLLDRWLTGYGEILKPALHIGNYRLLNKEKHLQWYTLEIENNEVIWGGEPAAQLMTNYLRAEILTIYTDNENYQFARKWKLMPNENGEVQVFKKFWKNFDEQDTKTAPPLLIWTDLQLTQDPRNLETAEMIYNQYLKNEFERTK